MEERQRLTPIPTPRVLWISDRADEIVDDIRLSLVLVNSALDGLSILRNGDFDVVLVSLPVPDRDSAAGLLEELQQAQPGTPEFRSALRDALDAPATQAIGACKGRPKAVRQRSDFGKQGE